MRRRNPDPKEQGRNQVDNRVGTRKKSRSSQMNFGLVNNLAATYSRGIYKTTTIGKTVFDGRVRNGNGSDHSFMATKKYDVKR
jgi:hypothetical protein